MGSLFPRQPARYIDGWKQCASIPAGGLTYTKLYKLVQEIDFSQFCTSFFRRVIGSTLR
ncbi:hypothetical protein PDR5_44070 [Pseudomonas sp. DR 5-09]|nr:hypothetical protein PDR5_44070 [Pseudomonas sp. DR 5-09]